MHTYIAMWLHIWTKIGIVLIYAAKQINAYVCIAMWLSEQKPILIIH